MASRALIVAVVVAAFSCSSALAWAQGEPDIRSQGGQTLEIAPNVASQNQQPPPQSNNNTRVIPVIPPSQQVLTLPQASRDFLGKWGGHLHRTFKFGRAEFPDEMVASLTFGDRDGSVVLATDVIGSRDANVLQTSADSDGPRAVTLTVQSVDISTQPALRQVNKLSVRLTSNNELEGVQRVDFYVTGFSQPLAEVEFEGKLKPLTQEEDYRLSEEVARSGKVLVGKIREGNPPPEDQY
jgi:hypothetical protein